VLCIPNGLAVRRVLAAEAQRAGRSVVFDVVRLRQFERELAATASTVTSVSDLVIQAASLGVALQPVGTSPAEAGWICAQAAATENRASLPLDRREAAIDELAALSSGRGLPVDALALWVGRHLATDGADLPVEPVRAVILAARTGYSRTRLDQLDRLSAAAAGALEEAGIVTAQLPLGESRNRSAAAIDAEDRLATESADLLIAFLHPPSIGVGMLLAHGLRHYPVVLLVASPGEPRPPLIDGLQIYAETITTDDPGELSREIISLRERRGGELVDRSDLRLRSVDRWAVLRDRSAPVFALPHWLPRERVAELLADPGRFASATVQELEAIAQAAAVPWGALAPDAPSGLALSAEEFSNVARVATADDWSSSFFRDVVTSIDQDRRGEHQPTRMRASISLDSPFDVRRYISGRGLVDGSK
jgi:hypothetical protein